MIESVRKQKFCDCGNVAAIFRGSGAVCDRCNNLENRRKNRTQEQRGRLSLEPLRVHGVARDIAFF